MKIIISPSKTQDIKRLNEGTEPLFVEQSNFIRNHLKTLSKDELQKRYKVSDKLMDELYDVILTYENYQVGNAIYSYTGAVFKNLDVETLDQVSLKHIDDHVVIFSALYGLLHSNDLIYPYRLDYNVKLPEISLYQYWNETINNYFNDEEVIINLASNEFSKILKKKKMINITFMEQKNGQYKVVSTFSKIARGVMLRYIAINQITNPTDIKKFAELDYQFNESFSDEFNYVFTKN